MEGQYSSIFIDTLIILTSAVIGASLAERLKLGSIIGYLAAGLIIGPGHPQPDPRRPRRQQALAELGIVLPAVHRRPRTAGRASCASCPRRCSPWAPCRWW
jgi:hypothetical protein